MTSAIDETLPAEGDAFTADMRANFAAAKTEILALQAQVGETTDRATWSPELRVAGSATGITYTTQEGTWRHVTGFYEFDIHLVLSNAGSGSGDVTIQNLPFTTPNREPSKVVITSLCELSTSQTMTTIRAAVDRATNVIDLHFHNPSGLQKLQKSALSNTGYIWLNGIISDD